MKMQKSAGMGKRWSVGFIGIFLLSIVCGAGQVLAMIAPIEMKGDYIWTGVSQDGTLGVGGTTSPGLIYDPTGTGTFNTATDYLTPGTPFEGFSLMVDGSLYNNNNAFGPVFNARTLEDLGGTAGYDHHVRWAGGVTGQFELVHEFFFNQGDMAISVRTSIEALTALNNVLYQRTIDPDQDYWSYGKTYTDNMRGHDVNGDGDFDDEGDLKPEDAVFSRGVNTGHIVALANLSGVLHNAAVTGWSQDPRVALAGTDVGDGDNTIALAYDLGNLSEGQIVELLYAYVLGDNYEQMAAVIFSMMGPSKGLAELHTSVPTVAYSLINAFQNSAGDRMSRLRQSGHAAFAKADPLDGLKLASAGDVTALGPIAGEGEKGKNLWVQVYGIAGDVDGDNNVGGYDYSVNGFSFGNDYKVCKKAYLGVMAGVSMAEVDTDLSDRADVTSMQVGVYSTYENGPFYLDGTLSYARNEYETTRDTLMGTAQGDYNGNEWGAALKAGYAYVNEYNGLILEPFLGSRYILLDAKGFEEKGAGNMNMKVDSSSDVSWKVFAGSKISSVIETEGDKVYVPEITVAFKRELGDDNDVVTANFVSNPAASNFRFEGVEIERNSFEVGLGVKMLQGDNLQLSLNLTTEFNRSHSALAASAGMKYVW